ncbi:head-tail connector protein [Methylobacterium nodulans]|uniref:Phage gp6-like head-tail connector protein n=1 Tax=Methylobacterium nodulans (strain LMG 21967 / CNCM I-2342 / ORS 2060) TaxID=460265 RepID=B8ITA2_METNO|nr:head-tail connector protein [Methylobacterium nodulans]ACL56988.1 phage conserved hypothetical protein, phiE125 gp8 [Methylobacterium nodulans ORS 2060]
MSPIVVTPPAPIVTLAQAKRHLRVEHDDDNGYISDLVEVATAWLDGPDGWLGRALGEQVLEIVFPAVLAPGDRVYPCPPFRAVESETPSADGQSITVRYRAGYPETGTGSDARSTVPAPIRHAILLMVGHFYTNRLPVTPAGGMSELPLGVDALLSPYRGWG